MAGHLSVHQLDDFGKLSFGGAEKCQIAANNSDAAKNMPDGAVDLADDDAGPGAQGSGEVGDGRGRHRSEQSHVDPGCRQAGLVLLQDADDLFFREP